LKIAIGCDHGGIDLKELLLPLLESLDCQINDLGCYSNESVDYPDFAKAVCQEVLNGNSEKGILICGTGIGMSMAANRYKGIRAALCHDIFSARMSREHNDANVLCLGARVTGSGLAAELVKEWINTEFAGSRHLRRIEMFS
jgi:ribose 5-phosphate isomerase B